MAAQNPSRQSTRLACACGMRVCTYCGPAYEHFHGSKPARKEQPVTTRRQMEELDEDYRASARAERKRKKQEARIYERVWTQVYAAQVVLPCGSSELPPEGHARNAAVRAVQAWRKDPGHAG